MSACWSNGGRRRNPETGLELPFWIDPQRVTIERTAAEYRARSIAGVMDGYTGRDAAPDAAVSGAA
ncbi:MAG: hypothetical protein U0670_23335 [Anaerolineae bacterium]